MEAEAQEDQEELVQKEKPADPGFVLDHTSGLYYHASSGFYHDPTAGWYYDSHDGVYYKFEGGGYTPLPALSIDIGPNGAALDSNTSDGVTTISQDDLSQSSFPLWHYDHGRCMYWYYHKDSAAYFMYGSSFEAVSDSDAGQELGIGPPGAGASMASETEDEPQPASKWIEETLIEMYLQGYPSKLGVSGDEVLKTDSRDTLDASQPPLQATAGTTHLTQLAQPVAGTQESLRPCDVEAKSHTDSPSGHDDDASEGLEEGEWVPGDEDWFQTDSLIEYPMYDYERERADKYVHIENDRYHGETESETEEGEWLVSDDADLQVCGVLVDDGLAQNKKASSAEPFVNGPELDIELSELDKQQGLEEQWQAQYGQVVQTSRRQIQLAGVVDLWDWTTIVEKGKGKRKKPSVRLVGRIASSRSKLHPSLSSSGGLIRTSKVCCAEYEFVKVLSGKVYRLRTPSSRQLASVTSYDSSNPTLHWGFPNLGLVIGSDETPVDPDVAKVTTDQVVSKPFIPNLGHWRFQTTTTKKRGRVPHPGGALVVMSGTETIKSEERKQKYRDRAAERRTLHRGFGNGPGQKDLPVHEIEKLEAELATEMIGALQAAADAPPLGKDNKGKLMLQSMGWKEGQRLGVSNEGLVCPILASGNSGRAGLGWK